MRRAQIEKWLPILAITAVWAGLHALFIRAGGALKGDLLATDPYMRLVRVSELVHGGGWFDSVIQRSNAPFGDELHWTRPLDVLLTLLSAPLAPFVGFPDALFTAGVLVSPLLHLVLLFAIVWTARPLLGTQRARLAAIVAVVQPAIFLQLMPGQADHHALQLLSLTVELGLLLRLLVAPTREHRWLAITAGAVAGFAIWISPEMTILAGIAAVILGLAWLVQRVRACVLREFAVGMVALILLALLTERPPVDWLAIEYDRVSIAHLAAAIALLCVSFGFEWVEPRHLSFRGRFAVALSIAGVAAAALLLPFGGLIEGPASGLDPRLGPIWLDHVAELQPLFPRSLPDLGWFFVALGPAVIALPFAVAVAWRSRSQPAGPAWVAVALFFLVYFVFALRYVRFAPFAGVLLSIVSAELLGRMREWMLRLRIGWLRRVAWAFAAPAFIVGFMLVGGLLLSSTLDIEDRLEAREVCDLHATAAAINAQPDSANAVVYAHIDFGPELLYRTNAAIVAGPYHRNGSGILEVHDFFSSLDPDHSRQLLEARGGRFVLVCDTRNEAGFFRAEEPGESLYERLVNDDPPEWLWLAARGTEEQRFRLYEVRSK